MFGVPAPCRPLFCSPRQARCRRKRCPPFRVPCRRKPGKDPQHCMCSPYARTLQYQQIRIMGTWPHTRLASKLRHMSLATDIDPHLARHNRPSALPKHLNFRVQTNPWIHSPPTRDHSFVRRGPPLCFSCLSIRTGRWTTKPSTDTLFLQP